MSKYHVGLNGTKLVQIADIHYFCGFNFMDAVSLLLSDSTVVVSM